MAESTQHILSRVRPPRVQITYDVEIGDAIEQRELPFIVGILADLGGKRDPDRDIPPLKDRKFVKIDRDNLNKVMAGIKPRVVLQVENVLPGDNNGQPLNEILLLESMDDFDPLSITKKLPALNELYKARCRLRDFVAKMDGNDPLYQIVEKLVVIKKTADELDAEISEIDTEISGLDATADADKIASLNKRKDALTQQKAELGWRKELTDAFKDKKPEEWKDVAQTDTMKAMISGEGAMALDENQQSYAMEMIGQFTASVLTTVADDNVKDGPALMGEQIVSIDKALGAQLNLILHDEGFKEVEAAWRGLSYLVMNTETSSTLQLKLLNATRDELFKDLEKAVEFDQSALFKKIYEEEYGTYGGDPFSMLVGDFEFGRHPEHIALLERISNVAAAAHTPFIASAYAKLFDMNNFSGLSKPRDLSKIFESAELIKWRGFRETEDSRYVTLTLPKVLMRQVYGKDFTVVDDITFEEDVNGIDASKYLWANAAYVLTERITNAFAHYGWTAAIRGVEGGGLVEDLPIHTFKTADGDTAITCPTQVSITDRREKELNDLGFMTICHCKGTDKAAFFGGQSTNKPKKYNTDSANNNAQISAMLPYVLNASRFAHYIKVIMRDKVGSFQTRSSIEEYLNNWISKYVLLDESAGQEAKAAYPLQQGHVVVTEINGKPGAYNAVVFLRPHFQLEELTASIRLVAEIPG